MNWNIRYSKDDIARAQTKGKHVFAIGYYSGGRAEAFMYMDEEPITLLWCMAHEINSGKTPSEAFALVEARIAEHKAKITARAVDVVATNLDEANS